MTEFYKKEDVMRKLATLRDVACEVAEREMSGEESLGRKTEILRAMRAWGIAMDSVMEEFKLLPVWRL